MNQFFLYVLRQLYYFSYEYPVFPAPFCWTDYFSLCILLTFVKDQFTIYTCVYFCVSLVHIFIFKLGPCYWLLQLWDGVSVRVGVRVNFKSGRMMPPSLFFFLLLYGAIWTSILYLLFSYLYKNTIKILIGIALNF